MRDPIITVTCEFEVRIECMECGHLWFLTVTADEAYEVEDQIADHEHRVSVYTSEGEQE